MQRICGYTKLYKRLVMILQSIPTHASGFEEVLCSFVNKEMFKFKFGYVVPGVLWFV